MGIRRLVSSTRIGGRRDGLQYEGEIIGPSRFISSAGGGSKFLLDYSQATFTRTTEAAFQDPRLSWSFASTDFGTYQSFNHLSNYNAFNDGTWTTTNAAITSSIITTPNGGTANEIGDWDGAAFGNIFQTINTSGSFSKCTATFYVLKDNDESRFPEFALDYSPNASNFRVDLNTKTGAIINRITPSDFYASTSSIEDAGSWWKLILTRVSNINLRCSIFPSVGINFGTTSNTATGSIIIGDISIKEELHDAWKPANKPRIFSDGAILIEGSRTNAFLYSTPESHYQQISATASFAVGPDGLNEWGAYVSGTSENSVIQYIPITGSHLSTSLSVFHKADTAKNWRWVYRNGTIVNNPTAATSSINWHRAQITLLDFDNRAGWKNGSDGNSDPMYLAGFQLETGSFASSLIRTNGAAVTRGAETCLFTTYPDYFLTQGFEIDVYPMFSSRTGEMGSAPYIFSWAGSGTRYLLFQSFTEDIAKLYFRNAAGVNTGDSFSFSANDKITAQIKHNSYYRILVNDVQVSYRDIVGDWSDRAGDTLSIGSGFFGIISRPRKL